MKKHFWLPTLLLSTTTLQVLAACNNNKQHEIDMDALKSAYTDIMVQTTYIKDYQDKTAQQIIDNELESIEVQQHLDKKYQSYFFKDLDYSSKDTSKWPTHTHIVRTLQIAVSAQSKSKEEKEALLDIATKLTLFWISNDFENPNWWFNSIGVPRDLGDVALLIFDRLSVTCQERLLEIVRRGSFWYHSETTTFTGTNLFWYGDITLKCALLNKSLEEVQEMLKYVIPEIKEDANEGFQSDGTYFQHDHIIYNGGYGRQALMILNRIVSSFYSCGYEWPTEKLSIIVRSILEGVKYLTFKGQYNYLSMGRTHVRKTSSGVDAGDTDLGNVLHLHYLTKLKNCPHKQEINQLMTTLQSGINFTGTKCYPKSSCIVTCYDGVYMSFKGSSNTLIGSETANLENVLGHNFSFGANTCVMQTGNEYRDVTPNIDYSSLPGTTTIHETDEELQRYDDDDFKPPQCDGPFFCGEQGGVAFSMQKNLHLYRRPNTEPIDEVHYTITCFATDKGMVFLGAGIHYDIKNNPWLTTHVEQCRVTGDVTKINDQTIQHGNVVYKIIGGSETNMGDKFVYDTPERTWSWNRNNRTYLVSDTQTDKIFTLDINHTTNSTSQEYAYSIQSSQQSAFNFIVANNTEQIQAIDIGNNKLAVACYEPGQFVYGTKTYIIHEKGYSVINK